MNAYNKSISSILTLAGQNIWLGGMKTLRIRPRSFKEFTDQIAPIGGRIDLRPGLLALFFKCSLAICLVMALQLKRGFN
jgi:hypothetical protein